MAKVEADRAAQQHRLYRQDNSIHSRICAQSCPKRPMSPAARRPHCRSAAGRPCAAAHRVRTSLPPRRGAAGRRGAALLRCSSGPAVARRTSRELGARAPRKGGAGEGHAAVACPLPPVLLPGDRLPRRRQRSPRASRPHRQCKHGPVTANLVPAARVGVLLVLRSRFAQGRSQAGLVHGAGTAHTLVCACQRAHGLA